MSKTKKLKRYSKKKKNSNRRKSHKTSPARKITSSPFMAMYKNPLSSISGEDRKELLSNIGRQSKVNLTDAFDFLNETLRYYDPVSLLANLSGYGLITQVRDDGVRLKEDENDLNQSHVEFLQALALQIPFNELGCHPVLPNVIQNVWGKLLDISRAFSFCDVDENVLLLQEKDFAISQVQQLVRSNTLMVRNWGFHSQVINISKELYGFFDELLLNNLGFSASNIIDTFRVMVQCIDIRLSQRLEILSVLKSTKSKYDLLIKYYELIGQGEKEAKEFITSFDINIISKKKFFFMLLSHFDLSMSDNFFFNTEYIAAELNLDETRINKILNHFSLSFGDLSHCRKEFFFLDNPVWNKPVVSTNDGYFCPIPQMFFSFVLDILDETIEVYNKTALHKRRAVFLEKKIEEIVKRRFPESQTYSGIKWEFDGKQYETDLITIIDSHLLIIEAKSQKISRPALRGAPERIRKHLEEILINSGVQSFRLEQLLNKLNLQKKTPHHIKLDFPFDIDYVHKIIRISVSLENFASLQANLSLFDKTGWTPVDFSPCPSMNLADFEILFDFLEHPVQIVHYLQRRTELQNIQFLGDELDFMGLYITTLLNLGNINLDDHTDIIISGMSSPLDKYYMSREYGINIKKPQPIISPLFEKMFNKLEERATPRWSEIGSILNRFPPNIQYELTRNIKSLSKQVNKTWKIEGHKNIIIVVPDTSEYALVVVLYKNGNQNKRNDFLNHAVALGFKKEYVKYCLAIAINIDRNDLPYHYIALYEDKSDDQM
ncbi:hypothetical protein [Nitrosomonas sp.]|uniref:hypothetical protein n=1 Tax=Nitrosomonas sp. TaxID=42353 RepID=UPI0025D54B75|nr:hypothetical protein [Nitrosomonas sp.]